MGINKVCALLEESVKCGRWVDVEGCVGSVRGSSNVKCTRLRASIRINMRVGCMWNRTIGSCGLGERERQCTVGSPVQVGWDHSSHITPCDKVIDRVLKIGTGNPLNPASAPESVSVSSRLIERVVRFDAAV